MLRRDVAQDDRFITAINQAPALIPAAFSAG